MQHWVMAHLVQPASRSHLQSGGRGRILHSDELGNHPLHPAVDKLCLRSLVLEIDTCTPACRVVLQAKVASEARHREGLSLAATPSRTCDAVQILDCPEGRCICKLCLCLSSSSVQPLPTGQLGVELIDPLLTFLHCSTLLSHSRLKLRDCALVKHQCLQPAGRKDSMGHIYTWLLKSWTKVLTCLPTHHIQV